jgi:DNA-3-methyladenine glycosylase
MSPLPAIKGPRAVPREFYSRGTVVVARELIGKLLVRVAEGKRIAGMIVEAEAYVGEADTACHASRGRTRRTEVMFGPPGRAYVYFTYGMHWMLNVVTEPEGTPCAVLIRALEPLLGIEEMRTRRGGRPDRELTSGPARLCEALAIDGALNGADLVEGTELLLETYQEFTAGAVASGPRIGIDYAVSKDRRAAWRFWLKKSAFVSKARPGR